MTSQPCWKLSGIHLEWAPEDNGLRREWQAGSTRPPAHGHVSLILLSGQVKSIPLSAPQIRLGLTRFPPKGNRQHSLVSMEDTMSLLPFVANSTVENQWKWQYFLAIKEISNHQRSLHGRHVYWNPLDIWPCSDVFIRAFPSHGRGF